MKFRRYQLTKEAVAIVYRDQPWIFRDHLSSAAKVFHDGDWLRLVDGENKVIGYGIYDAEGAIAIRIVRRGETKPDAAWLRATLTVSLAKRAPLVKRTNGIRLVHGESDGVPGVVVDRFGDTLVAQSYTRGADSITRFAAIALANELRVPNVLLRPAHRRKGEEVPTRVLRGSAADIARFTEDGVEYAVDLARGQKSGTYLDLRGLRRAIATTLATATPAPDPAAPSIATIAENQAKRAAKATPPSPAVGSTRSPSSRPASSTRPPVEASFVGARVLNLFAYSGMLGRAAEQAGAASITHVDASESALAFAKAHHVADAGKHVFVTADIFQWLPALALGELYDLVIVDPPSMTSNKQQVPAVLAGYKKLYRAVIPHVKPGGFLVAACCTSRVERHEFHATVASTLGAGFEHVLDVPPELDHPATFAQSDYLKIEIWRRR
ncbi:MAG: class I SAM-dependent rRNA methyltransferase [Kofleriaceae bacterium]